MPYLMLAGAILAEVVGTIAMKYSDGFTRLWPSSITVISYLISFTCLAQALRGIAVGTAYAIWSAVGTAVIAIFGMIVLGEAATLLRIAGIGLIIGGVVVLNLAGAH